MANIAVVMVDGVADWEIGVVLPAAREWFGDQVAIASIDGQPLQSIGGVRITPEFALSDLAPLQADLWILPGSERWQAGEIPGLSGLLVERVQQQRPVAAICGATLAFAYAGLLDERAHTSNALAFLQEHVVPAGAAHYRHEKVVSADGVITAPGTSPVNFALACMRQLHPERTDTLAQLRGMFAGEFV
ncbi:type 1 glutamine amidotransferase family protein [Xanthomonas phaseoli]|uniref:Peptidase n=1 Tax=Xanthomonas phaseoli pv. dieffenbachiae TaxID=92828 RepID=A0A1V9HEQ4_9XANT|nr:type 1 glutamine amidotransferase family protein [Xanthomonas phaseoli]MBO9786332.1 glutamine amidotransferase [Xanthomonas phaseoli pv. dieffenbachiae]MBO9831745.1 glutamine amidotransferase [Xanthomonas phaseoli pv. dieffenbachiae]MBO9835107.1 glutamine amidotransferase [Xanthomonas phaseoli pv. dieffenbachiae]MBO9842284.1 glutamine amidotransferase [Xanthomonas phaseoli pv. dieffenbachiae]MBO9852906.1 glutamine amidotransferase [Xanthomonas phaseoli pv. dieffenbachiae]